MTRNLKRVYKWMTWKPTPHKEHEEEAQSRSWSNDTYKRSTTGSTFQAVRRSTCHPKTTARQPRSAANPGWYTHGGSILPRRRQNAAGPRRVSALLPQRTL
jgi:hypothetical protein